ncbi:hypothetical protein [Pontibacter burrus]|uniref:Uncharacterized protein n=1 Tax=Pontibacter burrus TaxID=2704466 RepID=A0A6B3LV78_9BACT|nr:hypothetical protein [Pontibacter burrus]NEM97450.1 hypothetical protein [Pontibacter burrus]
MESTYSLANKANQPKGKVAAPVYQAVEMPADVVDFATIDGGVIDYYACEQAVSRGAGIFIGGYFVGVTEFSQCYEQQTFMSK